VTDEFRAPSARTEGQTVFRRRTNKSLTLGDFIRDVLVEVSRGVTGANEVVRDKPFLVVANVAEGYKERPGIRFDVAVTVAGEAGGSGALRVYAVELGGEAKRSQQTVHRVQFEVGLRNGIAD
jgi:hypothetical protein